MNMMSFLQELGTLFLHTSVNHILALLLSILIQENKPNTQEASHKNRRLFFTVSPLLGTEKVSPHSLILARPLLV